MTFSINVVQHADFFEVVVTGTYYLQEAINKFHYVLTPCNITGISKFLVDFRKLSGDRAALEKIIYALEIQNRYFEHLAAGGPKLLVASVGNPSQTCAYEPGLEIARQSDMPFTLFTSIEDAYEWLDVHAT